MLHIIGASSMTMSQAINYAKHNQTRYLSELKEFVAIPTVSTLPQHKPDMQRGADWLSRKMRELGLENVEVIPTMGHPVVYGDWLKVPGKQTVLVYGHYDVQPVDPLSEWVSPPFQLTVRGENIFGRGASDMKGNGVAVLNAMEAWMKNDGMPVNVKVLFEGEEEIGSDNLEQFIESHKEKLKCDVFLSADALITGPNLPSLALSARGIVFFEVWVYGPKIDLHSGEFGGAVPNPAKVLCDLIAGMHDTSGRVTIPRFYDQVRKASDEERAELARTPLSDEEFRQTAGASQLDGEKGFTTLERLGVRPTLEINGLLSGFTGEGEKNIVPARAMAKISMRLVPDQDPQAIEEGFREYMRTKSPTTVEWSIKKFSSVPAVVMSRNSPGMRAASKALEDAFQVKPIFRLGGGTLPVVGLVQEKLGVEAVMMGFSLPEDNLHAPNEKYYLPNLPRAIEAYIRFFEEISHVH